MHNAIILGIPLDKPDEHNEKLINEFAALYNEGVRGKKLDERKIYLVGITFDQKPTIKHGEYLEKIKNGLPVNVAGVHIAADKQDFRKVLTTITEEVVSSYKEQFKKDELVTAITSLSQMRENLTNSSSQRPSVR